MVARQGFAPCISRCKRDVIADFTIGRKYNKVAALVLLSRASYSVYLAEMVSLRGAAPRSPD